MGDRGVCAEETQIHSSGRSLPGVLLKRCFAVEECAVIKNRHSVNKLGDKDRFMSLAVQAGLHMLLTLDGERN